MRAPYHNGTLRLSHVCLHCLVVCLKCGSLLSLSMLPQIAARAVKPSGNVNLNRVADIRHPGSLPGDIFGHVVLTPELYLSRERDMASLDLHHNLVVGEFGMAREGTRNAPLDLLRSCGPFLSA